MKLGLLTLAVLLSFAVSSMAADSISLGVRAGTVLDQSGQFTEVFGDLHLNRLVSIGATVGYMNIDSDHKHILRRDESMPITALFKVHAPTPVLKPYAGLGQALIFHNNRGTKGSVVGLVGLNLPIGKFFLNTEYRHQFDDELNLLAGGVGISF